MLSWPHINWETEYASIISRIKIMNLSHSRKNSILLMKANRYMDTSFRLTILLQLPLINKNILIWKLQYYDTDTSFLSHRLTYLLECQCISCALVSVNPPLSTCLCHSYSFNRSILFTVVFLIVNSSSVAA